MAVSPDPQDFSRKLGRIVANSLSDKGISQVHAADLTGIPFTTFRRHLKGNGDGFKTSQLYRIAGLLDVSVADLFAKAESEDAA